MEAERKWISTKLGWLELCAALGYQADDIDCFSGDVEVVISRLQSLSVYCVSIGYKDANLKTHLSGDEFELEVDAQRLETQEEANKRVEKNRKERERQAAEKVKQTEQRESRDRSEYERLKKKYS